MRTRTLLVVAILCFCFSAARAYSFSAQKEQLRQLLPIPVESLSKKVALTMGLAYFPSLGRVIVYRFPSDFPQPIAKIHRQLRSDPDDASLLVALGNLYQMQGEPRESAGAYAQAQAIFLRQIARRPDDGRRLRQYGELLTEMGRSGQAEGVLRNALSLAPGDWQVWATLGQCLQRRLPAVLEGLPLSHDDPTSSLADIVRVKPTPERIREALSLRDQARRCLDRAVALAPEEPQVYLLRARFYGSDVHQTLEGIPMAQDRPSDVDFSAAALADYRRAAALKGADAYTIALPVWEDLNTFAASHQLADLATPDIARRMSPQSRHAAAAAIAHLRSLSNSSDPHLAAQAFTALAWTQYEFYGQGHEAQLSLNEALARDPSLDEAADYLLHVSALQRDFPRVVAVCQERLRRRNSARLHIIEAYALYKEGNLSLAAAHAEEACDQEPGDLDDLLILSWFSLKAAHDTAGLARAGDAIKRAGKYLGGATSGELEEYDLLSGVRDFLADQPEEAREEARHALAFDPSSPVAIQLNSLMNGKALLKEPGPHPTPAGEPAS